MKLNQFIVLFSIVIHSCYALDCSQYHKIDNMLSASKGGHGGGHSSGHGKGDGHKGGCSGDHCNK